jgi:hypothetical protein
MFLLQCLAQTTPVTLTDWLGQFSTFGTAGVMGAMWLWERRQSSVREKQIDEAHERILSDKVQLDQLMALVRQNTEALDRLRAAQEQVLANFKQ